MASLVLQDRPVHPVLVGPRDRPGKMESLESRDGPAKTERLEWKAIGEGPDLKDSPETPEDQDWKGMTGLPERMDYRAPREIEENPARPECVLNAARVGYFYHYVNIISETLMKALNL